MYSRNSARGNSPSISASRVDSPARSGEPAGESTLEALIEGLFPRALFLEYIRNCVAFEEDRAGRIEKKVAGYHQFRALRTTTSAVADALRPAGDGRGGVVWHTQGSGKSF